MVGNGAVGGLILEVPVGADQHAGHHGQGAGGGGDEVAHHVTVVVLAGPDHAAGRADDFRGHVVDEGVAIGQAGGLELVLELLVKDLLEQNLEGLVIVLGDGVLGGEPHVLAHVQRIGEAAAGEGQDGGIPVVHALDDAGTLEIKDGLAGELLAVLIGEDHLGLARTGDAVLHGLVNVAVSVTGDGDGLLPAGDHRLDLGDEDRGAEDRTVQRRADGGVGGLPHLLQVVLLHPLEVGGDGGALHAHVVDFDGLGRLDGDLVIGLVPVGQTQVIILRVQLHEGQNQLLLDHGPEDAGHFIAVDLDDGVLHFDLFHGYQLLRQLKPCSGRRSGSSGSR